jgi:hypothetical protein
MPRKIMRSFLTFLYLSLVLTASVIAQDKTDGFIQFSGVVVDGEDLRPIPFTAIIIKDTHRGTVSDAYGFFSIVAKKNDTIEFSYMGYKKARFVIPDSLEESRYSLIQMMFSDTIMLKESVIYPWPTKEQFKDAFMSLRIPDDDLERARKNLSYASMKDAYRNMPMDGSMNYKWQMQQQQSRLYFAGQYPPNNLLNPIAWARFIEAWKNGDLKNEK